MEKFSAFRDAATGLAPFVEPVAVGAGPQPALYALYPLLGVLSLARLLLSAALMLVCWLLSSLLLPLKHCNLTHVYIAVDNAQTAVLLRLVLALVGYLWIPTELTSLKRGFASASKAVEIPLTPHQGDLIVTNHTSPIEVLYLAFKFNPTFLLPVANVRDQLVGFRPAGWFSTLWQTARLPALATDASQPGLPLATLLERQARPCCIFPECTTTNNRALLQFSPEYISSPSSILTAIPPKTRLFPLCFKHELPSLLCISATLTLPSALSPLPHLAQLALWPGIRSMQFKALHSAERPSTWLAAQDAIAQMGKLKVVRGLSWKDKRRFLDYRNSKSATR